MRKVYFLLIFVLLTLCSCASLTSASKLNWQNVNLFENWEIPKELKQAIANYSSDTEKIVIFDKTKTYIPAEKIFVMQALDKGAGLVHVASERYDYSDGFRDRYDNLALFIYSDYLYDDQVIDVARNEELKQIGVYKYRTANKDYEQYKTVPIIILINEKMLNQYTAD